MILKRPYAFLIKHFKIIHIVIALLSCYIAFFMNNILKYINQYFKTSTGKALALQYINYSIVIAIVIAIGIVLVIIFLMKFKKKPRMIYWFYVGFYIVTGIILFVSFGELKAIFTTDATMKGIKAVRDLLKISLWIQYYFIACMLIRGLGFDIKRFNFNKDLEEFQLSQQDNEEVEVTFEGNSEDLKRRGRRSIRELRYYYIENKYMINLFLIFAVVGVVGYIITDRTITNVVYTEGDDVKSGIYTFNVVSSYITDRTRAGNKILDNNDRLVIVRFKIKNSTKYKYKINLDYLGLDIGDKEYLPTNKYSDYFKDIGTNYRNQYITSDVKYFILIYRISEEDSTKRIKFAYHGSYNKGTEIGINLDPVNMGNKSLKYSVKINEELKFKNSLLGDSKLKIKSYEIKDQYEYNYCYKDDCNYKAIIDSMGNNIIKLDVESVLDSDINLENDWGTIMNNYMDVYYVIDDVTYDSVLCYSKYFPDDSNKIYIEVDKDIDKASKIWLSFNIRNQVYEYVIKES